MTVNSYLEYFLTLLGWHINNGVWHSITATGLFALPFLAKLLELWLKARQSGAAEGNKSGLALTWMENMVYTSILVIMFSCLPYLNIDLQSIKYDANRSKQCGVTVTHPSDTGYAALTNELNGKTAAVPIWWYFIHALSKGMTNAAVSAIPCQPDLRQLRFEVQHTRIKDPIFAQEIQDFVQQCYVPSRTRLIMQQSKLNISKSDDVGWIGSHFFLNTPGYYDTDHAQIPRKSWPYDHHRDTGLYNPGEGGYPTCTQWWTDKGIGIRDRALSLVRPTIWQMVTRLGQSKGVYEEAILRTIVSQRNMQVSQNGRVYPGYGGDLDGTLFNAVARTTSTLGHLVGSLGAFPAFDSVRQALPMVQALLLMALVVCFPIVILFSAYSIKTIITLSFVQFALCFLTFWWELARWLDSWLIGVLYNSSSHSRWNFAGLQNTQDDLIINLVMGTMFIVLPAFWLGSLVWAGVAIGSLLSSYNEKGTSTAQKTGGLGAGAATKIASK